MHRNTRKKFLINYKFINIHKYKNCLYGNNYNKIKNYFIHFWKKHNIILKHININLFKFEYNEDIETFIPSNFELIVGNNNKWLNKLKLICEENECKIKIVNYK